MPGRLALLALLAAVGGLFRLSADPPPPAPAPPRLPEPRAPTAAEFDATERAVRAAGGRVEWPRLVLFGFFPMPLRIELDRGVTAEQIDRLPDPDVDYQLTVGIDPTTPPGVLARLGRLRHLRRLELHIEDGEYYHGRDGKPLPLVDTAARVAELSAVPHLEHLYIDRWLNGGVGDEVVAVLPRFPHLRSVAGLTKITDAGAATLARLDRLEWVGAGGPNLTDAGLAQLARLPRLRSLGVSGRAPLTADSLRPFTAPPRLTLLSVQQQALADDAMEAIGRIRTLEVLLLGTMKLDPGRRCDLEPLARLPRLRLLETTHNPAGDEELDVLSRFLALEYVNAGGPGVTDAGAQHLARLKTLRRASLYAPKVTDTGLTALATLPQLESLSLLPGPGVTDTGLDALAAAPSLAHLSLSPPERGRGVNYTEAGLRRFVAARGPHLAGLSTRGAGVGDDFVAHLAAHAPNLTGLSLRDSPAVTDRSVPALLTLDRLRALDLHGTSVRHTSRPALEARFPHARLNGPDLPRPVPPAARKE